MSGSTSRVRKRDLWMDPGSAPRTERAVMRAVRPGMDARDLPTLSVFAEFAGLEAPGRCTRVRTPAPSQDFCNVPCIRARTTLAKLIPSSGNGRRFRRVLDLPTPTGSCKILPSPKPFPGKSGSIPRLMPRSTTHLLRHTLCSMSVGMNRGPTTASGAVPGGDERTAASPESSFPGSMACQVEWSASTVAGRTACIVSP